MPKSVSRINGLKCGINAEGTGQSVQIGRLASAKTESRGGYLAYQSNHSPAAH